MLEKLLIQETTGQRRKLRLPLLAPETTRLSPSHDSLPNQSRLGTSTTTPATTNLLSVSPGLITSSLSCLTWKMKKNNSSFFLVLISKLSKLIHLCTNTY